MKKLYIILFLLMVLIGFIGNAAKIGNDYLDNSGVTVPAITDDQFSIDNQRLIRMDPQRLSTLGILLGTGLVGLLIVRRK